MEMPLEQITFAMEKVDNDITRLVVGLQALEGFSEQVRLMPNVESNREAVKASLGAIRKHLDFDSEADTDGEFAVIQTEMNQTLKEVDMALDYEISMEGIRDVPMRIYRAIAKAIKWLRAKARSLWNALWDRNEKQAAAIEKGIVTFEDRMRISEEAISNFKLEPGTPLSEEQKTELKAAGVKVFTDPQGKVLTKEMYLNDMTLLIPPGLRRDTGTMTGLVMGRKFDNLISNIQTAQRWINKVTEMSVRKQYNDLIERVMDVKDSGLFNSILDIHIPLVTEEDTQFLKGFHLQKYGPLMTAKPIIGNIYPVFVKSRAGGLTLTKVTYSTQQKTLSKDITTEVPKALPKISYSDLQELQRLSNELRSKEQSIKQHMDLQLANLERHAASNGKAFMAAEAKIKDCFNGRNQSDITRMVNIVTGIPKSHAVAYSHLNETLTYESRLIASIDTLLVKIVGPK